MITYLFFVIVRLSSKMIKQQRSDKYRNPRCQCMKCLLNRGNTYPMILAKFEARNKHLSEVDPVRHPCGNGAMGLYQRRQAIASLHGFLISLPLEQVQAASYLDFPKGQKQSQPKVVSVDWVESKKRLIADYLAHENTIAMDLISGQNHFSLVCASRASALTVLNQCLQSCYPSIHYSIQRTILPMEMKGWHEKSKWNAHDVMSRSTVFTQLTHLQRRMVLAQSGLMGVLVSKLMTTNNVLRTQMMYYSPKILRACRIITTRVHDDKACEILANNRYGNFVKKNLVISPIDEKNLPEQMEWLCKKYPDIIGQIESDITQLKRGLISINVIFENAEYTDFIQKWLGVFKYFCNQLAVNFQKLNEMNRFIASTPKLSQMDFGRCLGYAKFVKALRLKLRNFANDSGSISSFLTFIKVDPRLANEGITLELSPKNHTNSEYEIGNHVPSRCPMLGPLKKQYQDFIPRLGDISWDGCRRMDGLLYKDTLVGVRM